MKKAFSLMLCLMMIFSARTVAFAKMPSINSDTYVVMEAKSGKVLLSRGADKKKYPASITKILTTGIALENGDPDDKHTMTYKATHSIERGSTHIALTEEEVVTVNDLLNATMIESANDAANGLAEYIAGDIDDFPKYMNDKAAEIGAVNSHFMNAHGLHHKEHYTTAYDMALITRWAMEIDGFREVFGAHSYSVPPTNKQPIQRNIGTHHMMFVRSKYTYEGATGGKLGWTPEAHHTMVTIAERDGMELICVVMDSKTQYEKFKDTTALFDYCFKNFKVSEIAVNRFEDTPIAVVDESGEKTAEVIIPKQKFFVVHSPETAKADIKINLIAPVNYAEDDKIAPQAQFVDDDGEELLTVDLEWDHRVVEKAAVPVSLSQTEEQKNTERMGLGWQVLWAIPAFLGVGFVVLLLIRHRNLKLKEQRRQQRRSKVASQIKESVMMTQRSGEPVMKVYLNNSSAQQNGHKTDPKNKVRGRNGYRK